MNLKITLVALLCSVLSFAQSLRERNLPLPQDVGYFDVGGPIAKPTVFYGVQPNNYNGQVILFNHGYIDLNETQFLFDNQFYQEAFDNGYQAVFVATTRGGTVWDNGRILAQAIDRVTQKFNVADVIFIGHSNGGKSAETAMTIYGKNEKVSKVFSLGTPFFGTKLADLTKMPFFRWIWKATGLSGGSDTSTRYYCEEIYRPIIDAHPRNEPEKFVSLGASAYYRGSTIANLLFQISGRLIGRRTTNDGVAPYYSTLRPGAEIVFSEKDPRAMFDHIDIALGQFSWPYIAPYLSNRNHKSAVAVNTQKVKPNTNILTSDYYISYSENEYSNITLDKNATSATVEIIHENKSDAFELTHHNKVIQKGFFSDNHTTSIEINQSDLKLSSDSRHVAFVKPNNGISMQVEHIKDESFTPSIKVTFEDNKKEMMNPNIKVNALLTRTSDLSGKGESNEPIIVEFFNKNGNYIFNSANLEEGVYNIMINGSNEGEFKRSLVTGFVVGDPQKALENITTNNDQIVTASQNDKLILYPTLVKDQAKLALPSNSSLKEININVYTFDGRLAKRFQAETLNQQNIDISANLSGLQKGIYILELEGVGTTKFLKQ